jgi:hypothetical protein
MSDFFPKNKPMNTKTKTKKTTKKGSKVPAAAQGAAVLREAEMTRTPAGKLVWPRFQVGDVVTVEAGLARRFTEAMRKKGMASLREGGGGGVAVFRLMTPEGSAEARGEVVQDRPQEWAGVIDARTVPMDAGGRVRWIHVFAEAAVGMRYEVAGQFSVLFTQAANSRGFAVRTIGEKAKGVLLMQLFSSETLPPPANGTVRTPADRVRDRIIADLRMLPPKWLMVLHDSVAERAGMEKMSQADRVALLEGGAA